MSGDGNNSTRGKARAGARRAAAPHLDATAAARLALTLLVEHSAKT